MKYEMLLLFRPQGAQRRYQKTLREGSPARKEALERAGSEQHGAIPKSLHVTVSRLPCSAEGYPVRIAPTGSRCGVECRASSGPTFGTGGSEGMAGGGGGGGGPGQGG